MKTFLTIFLTFVITLAGTMTLGVSLVDDDMPDAGSNAALGAAAFNCSQSGGDWGDNNCSCEGELEFENHTGYCITPFGAPGGALGEEAKAALDGMMAKNEVSDLPVVAYDRAGLLTDAEKTQLEEKLINPYIDYHANPAHNANQGLVSMYIEVPAEVGDDYLVTAIFKGGVINGFLFGAREQNYNYWTPDCMGGCTFSDDFKAKYPDVVAPHNN